MGARDRLYVLSPMDGFLRNTLDRCRISGEAMYTIVTLLILASFILAVLGAYMVGYGVGYEDGQAKRRG